MYTRVESTTFNKTSLAFRLSAIGFKVRRDGIKLSDEKVKRYHISTTYCADCLTICVLSIIICLSLPGSRVAGVTFH